MRSLTVVLLFAFCVPVHDAGAVTVSFTVEPGTTVKVGQEVLFNAMDTEGMSSLLPDGRFEWDFGNGYTARDALPYSASDYGGVAVSHYFMNPGTYQVKCIVTDSDRSRDSATVGVTVLGADPRLPPLPAADPLLELRFEDDLDDISNNDLPVAWQGGSAAYARGKEGRAVDLSGGRCLSVTNAGGVLAGMGAFSVSLWARKRTAASYGTLFELPNTYRFDISAQTLDARVYTSSGMGRANHFNLYDVDNTMWHHYVLTYDGSWLRAYIDGREVKQEGRIPEPHTGILVPSTSALVVGARSDHSSAFNGLIDNVKVYDVCLTERDIAVGFELWHADYHGRIRQYLHAQVPGAYTVDATNRLRITVTGDNGYGRTLVDKSGLSLEESVLLDNSVLPIGKYIVNASLISAGGAVLDSIHEEFLKGYAGIPKVGIDENNAVCINGEPTFLFTSWILPVTNMAAWKNDGYLNMLFGKQSSSDNSLPAWTAYLDASADAGLPACGPSRWDGLPATYDSRLQRRNTDMDMLEDFVAASRDKTAMMMYHWKDEPNLGGQEDTTPQVTASWTYKSHQLDPQHLVATGFEGYALTRTGDPAQEHHNAMMQRYCYKYNGPQFGGKRSMVADVYGMDYFPHEFESNFEFVSVADMALAVDHMVEWNHDLMPFTTAVETRDQWDDADPGVTPEEIRMLVWLNIVHGATGILWFNYFHDTPWQPDNYTAMANCVSEVTGLQAVILGADPERRVTDNADEPGNRVDFIVRETDDEIYIFAVRLTERDYRIVDGASSANTIDAGERTVRFTVPGLDAAYAGRSVVVHAEDRELGMTDGVFQDTFAPHAVHIYRIGKMSGIEEALAGRRTGLHTLPNPVPADELYRHLEKYGSGAQVLSVSGRPVLPGAMHRAAGMYLIKAGTGISRIMVVD